MRHRIIFLDIDGVLNTALGGPYTTPLDNAHPDRKWLAMIDPEKVAHLNAIVHASRAKVVISSSWRLHFMVEDMQRYLNAQGFEGEVIDRTGTFFGERPHEPNWPSALTLGAYGFQGEQGMSDYVWPVRPHEVHAWLRDHQQEVEGFVILDDIAEWHWLAPHHVGTDMHVGLLEEHVQPALRILCLPADEAIAYEPKRADWIQLPRSG